MRNNARKLVTLLLVSCLLGAPDRTSAQDTREGGWAGAEQLLLTPDKKLNEQIAGRDIRRVPQFGFDDRNGTIVFNPTIPPNWNWIAAFNISLKQGRQSFFFYDGWLFTTANISSGRRRQLYERDVSGAIRSNAYHVAYHRQKNVENETIVLIVSAKDQRVRLELDSAFFGQRRVLEYDMKALEAKSIHLNILPKEFTTVTWHPEVTPRRSLTLNADWRFLRSDQQGAERPGFNDSRWKAIHLPHTWNAVDVYDARNVHDGLGVMAMYYRGKAWYRKSFIADASLRGMNVRLNFLGANQVAEVWLNGEFLGRHVGGYLGFGFDLTGRLRYGRSNVLAVRVDNSYNYDIPPHTADFDFYGGLYRDVELLVTDPVHVEKVDVVTPEVTAVHAQVATSARISNSSGLSRNLRLVTNVVSPYNEIVQSTTTTISLSPRQVQEVEQVQPMLANPLLWSPIHPWMYRVFTTVYDQKGAALDQVVSPLGFRWYQFDADSGFFLNGQRLKLRGVNLHQDYLNKGNAVGVDQKRTDLLNIKSMGANFIRLAHYPHHPAVLDLADSLGLLIWEEIPYINTIGRSVFMANARQMLNDMIERDRNHPSIILWGLGNEFAMPWLAEEDRKLSLQLTRELHDLAKKMDPWRLTAQAHNELIDTTIIGVTDVQGRNRYFGWYGGTYNDLGPALDEEKRKHPHWRILVSEYGAEGKYGYHVEKPEYFDHSETYQMDLHEANWRAIDERPWVAGGTIWNMYDFGSFRKIGNIPHINQKGMMTKDRKAKGVFYFYQSQWSAVPMVHIVSDTWTHRTGNRNTRQPVKVYSNCSEVELIVNGLSLGKKSEEFVWSVAFSPGENRLTAVGQKQGETVQHAITVFYRESE